MQVSPSLDSDYPALFLITTFVAYPIEHCNYQYALCHYYFHRLTAIPLVIVVFGVGLIFAACIELPKHTLE